MKVVVTGASGGIGRVLAEVLRRRHEVAGIVRSVAQPETVAANLGHVAFADAVSRDAALAAADCVIHCALDSKARGKAFLPANRRLTDTILAGALAGRCKLFVYFSSQVVYSGMEPAGPEGYREDQALSLSTDADDYTRLKIEGERQIADACRAAGVDYLIVRPTVVVGPGMAWSDGVVKAMRFAPIGLAGRRMNLVHVEDLAHMVEELLAQGARNEVFNLGGDNVDSDSYFREAGRQAGRRTLLLPEPVTRLATGALPSTLWFFKRDVGIDCAKIARVAPQAPRDIAALLGVRPAAGSLEALRDIQRSALPFKAYGSGYSRWYNRQAPGTPVSLAAYSGIVRLEGRLVTVRAGTRLLEISQFLDSKGLSLPTLPEFSGISAGACFFVDVHGSSSDYFSLYDLIVEIKYLDEAGEEITSRRDELGWAALRRRQNRFLLTEITFRCDEGGYLSNRLEWQDDDALPDYIADRHRENLSTTLQWYPFYRKMLVYNINRIEGAPARTSRVLPIYRGLPYRPQRLLLGAGLRRKQLLIDRYHAILSPWKGLPFGKVFDWMMSSRMHKWRDLELCLSVQDGQAFIKTLRRMHSNAELSFKRASSLGIRFSYGGPEAARAKGFVWIELVCKDASFLADFVAVARRVSKDGIGFHQGKYVPA